MGEAAHKTGRVPYEGRHRDCDQHTKLVKPGPFQIIEADPPPVSDQPINPPRRRFECVNYDTCLDLAAALNWDNFTCRGCSGEVNETLYWRAYQAQKKDGLVREICDLPRLKQHKIENQPAELKIVNK